MPDSIPQSAAVERLEPDLRGIHVWQAQLDCDDSTLARSAAFLTPAELDRARRFVMERDRRRWTTARSVLRQLLARYLGGSALSIEIQIGEKGKPFVESSRTLHFNLSHSAALAVFAFAPAPVGVDVESLRDVPDALDIARRFFAPDEFASLRRFPSDERPAAFLRCWTRKEAVLKTSGEGLTLPLAAFSVSLNEGPPALLRATGPAAPLARCALTNLAVCPGYIAALASFAPLDQLQLFDWNQYYPATPGR